jgi:hypothetical protein
MNSIQLAQRLGRNLAVEDPFILPADAALDVLAAINGGLASFYREAPGILKRTTLSGTLRAPRALTLTFQAQYSSLVADDTFTVREQGCTVRMGNGAADNIVTGPNSLLDDYLGTQLSLPATLYSDALPIQDVIERIVGNVRLYTGTQSAPTPLIRNERLRGGLSGFFWWYGAGYGGDGERYYPYTALGSDLRSVGRPLYYYLEPMGVSQGAEPEFILRVAPLPDIDYTVRLEAELSTQRLTFADLTTARQINVGEAHLEGQGTAKRCRETRRERAGDKDAEGSEGRGAGVEPGGDAARMVTR